MFKYLLDSNFLLVFHSIKHFFKLGFLLISLSSFISERSEKLFSFEVLEFLKKVKISQNFL